MPSPRLRSRRRRDCVTARHWMVFARGPKFGDPWRLELNRVKGDDIEALELILADMQRVWDSVKKGLLAHWIRHHPGTRPWAWWQFEAPEKHRRILSGPGYRSLAPDSPCCETMKRTAIRFGVCALLGPEAEWKNICESEWAYLKRLGLLTEEEKKIPASEFPTTNEDEVWHRDDEDWLPGNL